MNRGTTRPEKAQTHTSQERSTPQQRLERFVALQRRAFRLLELSPEGRRRFWARNLRQRRSHGPS